MDFNEALSTFQDTSRDVSTLHRLDLAIRMTELFSGILKRVGADQQKTNLSLEELIGLIEEQKDAIDQTDALRQALIEKDQATDRLIQGIIAVVDQLEDFYRYFEDKPEDAMYQQLQLMWSNVHSILAAIGLVLIDRAGTPYYPEWHQAERVFSDPREPSGQVIRILRSGYVRNGRVLRKALVVVNEVREKTEPPDEPMNREDNPPDEIKEEMDPWV